MSNEPRQNALAGATLKALMNSDHATKIAALAAVDANIAAELASKHLPVPKDIEGWEKLAMIVEIPKESISELTPIEIYNRALEWAEEMKIEVERRKILAQMMAGAGVEIGAPPTPSPPGHRQGERKAGSGTQDTKDDYMARLLSICINDVSDKSLFRAMEVLRNPSLSSNEKLTRLGELNLISPDASAGKLAKTLGVSATAVKKTKWWKNHMANRRDKGNRKCRSQESLHAPTPRPRHHPPYLPEMRQRVRF